MHIIKHVNNFRCVGWWWWWCGFLPQSDSKLPVDVSVNGCLPRCVRPVMTWGPRQFLNKSPFVNFMSAWIDSHCDSFLQHEMCYCATHTTHQTLTSAGLCFPQTLQSKYCFVCVILSDLVMCNLSACSSDEAGGLLTTVCHMKHSEQWIWVCLQDIDKEWWSSRMTTSTFERLFFFFFMWRAPQAKAGFWLAVTRVQPQAAITAASLT